MVSHYSASKFGVVGFSQAIAKELAKHNITVNVYCPGIVDAPMWDQVDRELCQLWGMKSGEPTNNYIKGTLLGRLSKPEDITGLVSFLASKDSDFMTGQSIILDGGIVIF